MSRAWRRGSTRRGRAINARVRERDGDVCQIRLPGTWLNRRGEVQRCRVRADCVHHTQGRAVTGDDPAYMVAACTPCNLKIGDPTRQPDPLPKPMTRW
jgi:hypothetical protein